MCGSSSEGVAYKGKPASASGRRRVASRIIIDFARSPEFPVREGRREAGLCSRSTANGVAFSAVSSWLIDVNYRGVREWVKGVAGIFLKI